MYREQEEKTELAIDGVLTELEEFEKKNAKHFDSLGWLYRSAGSFFGYFSKHGYTAWWFNLSMILGAVAGLLIGILENDLWAGLFFTVGPFLALLAPCLALCARARRKVLKSEFLRRESRLRGEYDDLKNQLTYFRALCSAEEAGVKVFPEEEKTALQKSLCFAARKMLKQLEAYFLLRESAKLASAFKNTGTDGDRDYLLKLGQAAEDSIFTENNLSVLTDKKLP